MRCPLGTRIRQELVFDNISKMLRFLIGSIGMDSLELDYIEVVYFIRCFGNPCRFTNGMKRPNEL